MESIRSQIAQARKKVWKQLWRYRSGCNGVYIRISSRVGMKILFYDTKGKDARKEMRNMQRARKRLGSMVPECYGVRKVLSKRDKHDTVHYRYAIFMEHVNGAAGDREYIDWVYLNENMNYSGVCHEDLHEWNIMVQKDGNCKVVDWAYANFLPEKSLKEHRRQLDERRNYDSEQQEAGHS